MPVSKKSAACELSHVSTPSINFSFLLNCWSLPVLQVGKQVVVARSEIRAVRRVVKQLPVEKLQQCSSVSSCYAGLYCHEGALHWMSALMVLFIFSVSQATHFWRYSGPWLHEFHQQHSFHVPENSWHQLSGRQTFTWTFSACLVNVCESTALITLWFQLSQTEPILRKTCDSLD
jgi:hypothetical protein